MSVLLSASLSVGVSESRGVALRAKNNVTFSGTHTHRDTATHLATKPTHMQTATCVCVCVTCNEDEDESPLTSDAEKEANTQETNDKKYVTKCRT